MTGIAIVIAGADFSQKSLGRITLLKDIDIEELHVDSKDTYTGISAQLLVTCVPENTSQTDCKWSIVSGSLYATIDESTGKLTILEGASSSEVTVKVVSLYNTKVYALKTIVVTYAETTEQLDGITDILINKLDNNVYELIPTFSPENTAHTEVVWSIVSGAEYINFDAATHTMTVLETATSVVQVEMKVISTYNTKITYEKTFSVQWKKDPCWDFAKTVGTIDLSHGLGELLTANLVTMYVEFSDDSTYHRLAGYNQGIVSTPIPADSTSATRYYPGAGLVLIGLNDNGLVATNNGFYGVSYTSEQTSLCVSKELKITAPSGSTPTFGPSCEIIMNSDRLWMNGNVNEMTDATATRKGYYQYLCFGFILSVDINVGTGKTCEEVFTTAINKYSYDKNLCDNRSDLKPTKIIIVPGYYSTKEAVLAARDEAYVDIKFNDDGVPYNAASDKGGVLSLYKLS